MQNDSEGFLVQVSIFVSGGMCQSLSTAKCRPRIHTKQIEVPSSVSACKVADGTSQFWHQVHFPGLLQNMCLKQKWMGMWLRIGEKTLWRQNRLVSNAWAWCPTYARLKYVQSDMKSCWKLKMLKTGQTILLLGLLAKFPVVFILDQKWRLWNVCWQSILFATAFLLQNMEIYLRFTRRRNIERPIAYRFRRSDMDGVARQRSSEPPE